MSSVHAPGNMQACSHICTFPQNESTRASSCRCQARPCRDLDVDQPLRSSQSFATIPTRLDYCLALISMARPCSSNTYTCTVRVGDRRHFCPLTCSNIVAGKPRPLKHYIRYVTHHARCNRHWAGLHALLGRENHVYGPAEGQLHP